jgi:biotin carboxyl carrier protein
MVYDVIIDGKSYRLELEHNGERWLCHLNGREITLDAVLSRPDVLSLLIEGRAYEIKRERTATDMHLWVGAARYATELRDPRALRSRRDGADDEKGPRKLVAPMPGRVVRVLVGAEAQVEAGQGVVVVEAMKMQNEIKSPKHGVVRKVTVAEGATVNAGDVLAIVE